MIQYKKVHQEELQHFADFWRSYDRVELEAIFCYSWPHFFREHLEDYL